jgi:hypothetical protein
MFLEQKLLQKCQGKSCWTIFIRATEVGIKVATTKNVRTKVARRNIVTQNTTVRTKVLEQNRIEQKLQ